MPGGPCWDKDGFDELLASARGDFANGLTTTARSASRIIELLAAADTMIRAAADSPRSEALRPSVVDADEHMARIAYPRFVTAVGVGRLDDIERYLRGIVCRLEKLPERVVQDQRSMLRCRELEAEHARLAATSERVSEVEEIAWSLQEFRMSEFAPAHWGRFGGQRETTAQRDTPRTWGWLKWVVG